MQTNLASWVRDTPKGAEADAILRRCVHCGFCTATCPTYQVLGDELDSPRGRIYLIKQMLEGETPTRATQQHLDRCLTCRNCETTCPSGVEYGHLIDLGREWVDQKVERPLWDRMRRATLRHAFNAPWFAPLMRVGKRMRPLLPAALKRKVPAHRAAGALPDVRTHARQVYLLSGCVQPAMMPTIDAATIRVLDAIGIGASYGLQKGCCGAINFHLDDGAAALVQMRANIDAWLPALESGKVEAIVMNASGCGAMVKDYAHHLRHDPVYAELAKRLVGYVKDVAELVAPHADELRGLMQTGGSVAFHPPCTLQHWQGLGGVTERMLVTLGFQSLPFSDKHLCCGSAGAYSVLQPEMSLTLRDRKLAAIAPTQADVIVSANVGCIGHLQSGTEVPVRHWIEWVDTRLVARP